MRRPKNMIDIARLLPKLLQSTGENAEMTRVAVNLAWQRAAGSGLQRQAVPFRFDGRKLVIAVMDSLWQKQLRSMGPELLRRINRMLGQDLVEWIDFQIAPALVERSQANFKQERSAKRSSPAPADVLNAASAIEDEDLRARFVRAAENCIARREARLTGRN
jgi:predicted nucleic acid-binding Zn ribbon protein